MGQTCGTRAESGYNKGYGTGSTWLQGTPKGAIEVEGGHQASEGQSSKWLPRQACENQVLQVIDGHKDRQKHWRPLFLLPLEESENLYLNDQQKLYKQTLPLQINQLLLKK